MRSLAGKLILNRWKQPLPCYESAIVIACAVFVKLCSMQILDNASHKQKHLICKSCFFSLTGGFQLQWTLTNPNSRNNCSIRVFCQKVYVLLE